MTFEKIRDYSMTDYKITGYGSKPVFLTICKTEAFGETMIDWEFFCNGITLTLHCDDDSSCVKYEMSNHPFDDNGILNDADEAIRLIEDFLSDCRKMNA